MRVITGKVVGGKIEVDTGLEEGTAVAILAADESVFELTADDEKELTAALDDIRRGAYVDGHELLRELRGIAKH